jgi:hypothetical protein
LWGPGDLVYLAYNMPSDLGNVDGSTHRLHLKVRALQRCPQAAPLLEDYLRIVQLATARYLGPDPTPTITIEDITSTLGGRRKDAGLAAQLLKEDGVVWSRWPSDWPDGWVGVSENVLRFRDVSTIDDYLQGRDGYVTPLTAPAHPFVLEEPQGFVRPVEPAPRSLADGRPSWIRRLLTVFGGPLLMLLAASALVAALLAVSGAGPHPQVVAALWIVALGAIVICVLWGGLILLGRS